MSDKTSSDTAAAPAETAPARSGGLLRTAVIVFLLLGIAGIGYVLGGRGAAPASSAGAVPADAAATSSEESEVAEEHGPVVTMDPININLAEGHYLRIAIALGLSAEAKVDEEHGFDTAPASDVVLSTFSGMAMSELTSADGREHTREQLLEALADHYGGDVVHVYFTEFVMQ
jgi:flagellar FliL protein